jgi:hypothetical protein
MEKSSLKSTTQKWRSELGSNARNNSAHGAGNLIGQRAEAEKVIAIQRRGQNAQANNRRCMFPAEAASQSRFNAHDENPPKIQRGKKPGSSRKEARRWFASLT